MREIVGIENLTAILGVNSAVKKDALFFNKIAIPYLNTILPFIGQFESQAPKRFSAFDERLAVKDAVRQTEWLIEKGFLYEIQHSFDSPKLAENPDFQKLLLEAQPLLHHFQNLNFNDVKKDIFKFTSQFKKPKSDIIFDPKLIELLHKGVDFSDSISRAFALQLRQLENIDAYPVLLKDITVDDGVIAEKKDVIKVSLNALPTPDENTDWEQILDFRNDADSMQKFTDLRIWINEITKSKVSPLEAEQKLEHLCGQYQKQLELHKMKTSNSLVETIITTSAEIAEDLANLKFSKAAKLLFSFKHRKIALLEGEQNAKGREIAYIIQSKNKFE